MKTTFDMTLDREGTEEGEVDRTIEVVITATGEYEEADPSVGLMSGGVINVEVTAHDEHGHQVALDSVEERNALAKAEEALGLLAIEPVDDDPPDMD